jgi:hypothetical protein
MMKMEAGRKLDALVAEKAMGAKVWDRDGVLIMTRCSPHQELPHYSTDWAAVGNVVKEMQDYQKPPQMGHPLHLQYHYWVKKWYASIGASEALEDTAPLAICLAALRAKGVEV